MNKDTYEVVRKLLSTAISNLLSINHPCGPNQKDLEIAIKIAEIVKVLGAEESASVQLNKVDESLGWWGSGRGRIEYIEDLKRQRDK